MILSGSLSWQSEMSGASRVGVIRSRPDGAGASTVARTEATQVTDRGLRNGTVYRYVIVQYDRAGNRSAGGPCRRLPRDDARLSPEPGGG